MTAINWHSLNWLDYSIVAVIVFSILISFFRGFLREAISLFFWVLALLLALKLSPAWAHKLTPWIGSQLLRYVICFMAVFLVTLIVGTLINKLVHAVIEKTGLSLTDRLLGIFFGAARGLAIVAVCLMFFSVGTVADSSVMKQSQLASRFQPMTSWLNNFLPKEITGVSKWLNQKVDQVGDTPVHQDNEHL